MTPPPAAGPRGATAGLLRFLRSEVPGPAAAVGFLALASAGLEATGLLLLVPLLSLAGLDLGAGGLDPLARAVGRVLVAAGLPKTLPSVLAVYVAAATGVALVGAAQAGASARLQARTTTALRRRLFAAVCGARWSFVSRRRASTVAHALTLEVDRVASAVHFLVEMAAGAALALVYLALALRVSVPLTGATLACGLLVLWSMRGRLSRARRGGEEVGLAMEAWYSAMEEQLASLRLHRIFGNAARGEARFGELSDRVAEGGRALQSSHARSRTWFEAGTIAALAVLVWISVEVFALPAGSLVLLLFLYARLMRRVGALQQQAHLFAAEIPAWETLARLEEEAEAEAEPRPAGGAPAPRRTALAFRDVSFRYGPDGPPALEGVTLDIPAGRTTAVVGPSGAGKSTLVDLAAGLLEPGGGEILLDGVPLAGALRSSWQSGLGVVPQDPFLFHDTVRGNLLWAAPGATEADLEEALRAADAWELVGRLPRGLDTVVGDRGATLSGGERQRIALARALVRRPSLLLLDEATSSLDSESEDRIRAALARLRGRATLLVVAHRLSTVREADAVHVLEGGRLVESGTFDGLLARPGGRLRALAAAQGIAGQGRG